MEVRHNWTVAEVRELMAKPFMDLLFEAQLVHRHYQQHNHVQVSTLLSIKTGACLKIVSIARRVLVIRQMLKKNV